MGRAGELECPRDRPAHRQPVADGRRQRGAVRRRAGPAPLARRGPGRRLDRRAAGRRAGVLPALVAPRHARTSSPSTRRTTPRTPGRCSATATSASTSRTPTSRSSTASLDGLWESGPSMIVHPEVGKWLIALGEKAFGMDPFGWRIAAAVVGSLMVLVMCRFVRRVTGSTALGLVGGLLLSLDGLHLVLSRLALLDIFLAFFILCGVHCVVADRQWFRERLAPGRDPAALPAVAAGRRGRLRARGRHQVDGALPARGLRPDGLRVELGRAPVLRPPPGAAARRAPRRGAGLPPPRGGRAGRLRGHLDRLAAPRRGVREGAQQHAVHDVRRRDAVADGHRAGRGRARRGRPVAALALVLPPGRLHVPRPLPQRQRARLRLQAGRLAADEPAGRASTRSSTSSPAPRGATPPRARPACARCCCSATR